LQDLVHLIFHDIRRFNRESAHLSRTEMQPAANSVLLSRQELAVSMEYPQVVKIFATTQEPDFDSPWQTRTPSSSTGSGVIIGPHRVLTGAHVVANATFLQVQKISDPDKLVARLAAVCHDCDLALLTVDGVDLTEGVDPAEIGDLPDLRDKVSVVGFPVGGEEISITEGVVSRIEVQRYSHSQRHLLAVTVDAAINEGNSGGPVFKDGKIAGIAFQKMSGADNIGELVPAPMIRHFLAGIDQGRAPDVPGLGIATQNLENPQLRRRLGLADGETGVLVTLVEYGGSAWGSLRHGDVLLEIDGLPIANNGTVRYRDRYRTRYDVVLCHHYTRDRLPVKMLRDGQRRTVELELAPLVHLVPRAQYDRAPTYFVFGGLVFQLLTRDFLTTWDKWWNKAPKEFLNYYYVGTRTEAQQEVVILTQILADELNVGYAHLYNEGVKTVNGQAPRDMRQFVSLVEQSTDTVEIETTSNGVIVLELDEVRRANPRILERYHIAVDRSTDLQGEQPAAGEASGEGYELVAGVD
jgi:S1-C subfamily serine protease